MGIVTQAHERGGAPVLHDNALPVPPPLAPHPEQQCYREVSSLHPGKISLESSLLELHSFITNYNNWFQISCIDTLDVAQQIFTLKNCCSIGIQEQLNWQAQLTITMALNSLRELF